MGKTGRHAGASRIKTLQRSAVISQQVPGLFLFLQIQQTKKKNSAAGFDWSDDQRGWIAVAIVAPGAEEGKELLGEAPPGEGEE